MDYFTFTETQRFVKRSEKLLKEDAISELQLYLCKHPEDGAIITNLGGIRKIRWAASGRGKRGGARIIYYFAKEAGRILSLEVYVKNEKENLSADNLNDLKDAVNFWLDQLRSLGELK